jgi:DNA polymerase-3 subunit epsilon
MHCAARQLAQLPALPAHLERAAVDEIPEAPGVYLFYGENDTPLYVGKSVAMRSRVLQHFASDARSPREAQIAREIRRIEWRRSCGELGALLREAALVKELLPIFNRRLRRASELCGFLLDSRKLNLVQKEDINSETIPFLCGVFRSKRAALDALRELADAHGLCLRALGFERAGRGGSSSACFRHQIRRCAGVCVGRESVQAHHARAAAALAGLKTAAWPWRGPIAIVEEDPQYNSGREAVDLHVVHHWCLLGTAHSEAEVAELLRDCARPRFDLDHYKILARHLSGGRARIVELGAAVH